MHLDAKTTRASELNIPPGLTPCKQLSEIVRQLGGDTYLSGPAGPSYRYRGAFRGIHLLLQAFLHPEYPQRWGRFLPNMLTVGLPLNTGEDARSSLETPGAMRALDA